MLRQTHKKIVILTSILRPRRSLFCLNAHCSYGDIPTMMKNYIIITMITLLLLATTAAKVSITKKPIATNNTEVLKKNTHKEAFDHAGFNELLNNHVTLDGTVDYVQLKKNKTVLRLYLAALGKKMPTDAWSQEDKLAYWMNAYNAMTIDLIIRNLPVASIKELKNPWKQSLWKLGGTLYNLNEIEHQILRKMGDPRIHFGINCASFSCPPLLNEAFTAKKVDTQLNALAKRFVNDTQRNTITPKLITISKIFNWFSKDFKQEGTLIDFLNKYANTKINNNAKVRYMDYNWKLNN
ncbi:MAG: hypothetical protein ACI9RL_001699 [Candidatus Paceibacteria bacterium]